MKKQILMLLVAMTLVVSMASVYALDESTPYTVTMKFVVGSDTSFTVTLAAAETSIDFEPVTANSKEVEPQSQNAGGSTPMVTITNTGNVALNFTQILNQTEPAWVEVSWSGDNAVNWTTKINDSLSIVNESVPTSETAEVYFWANFSAAVQGTEELTYSINSTTA